MTTFSLRRALPTVLVLLGVIGGLPASAAPNFPERYIDPDDLNIEEDEGADAVWPGGLTAFEGRAYDVYDGVGVVDELDPAGPSLLIDGLRFAFDLEPEIRLRAGAGAPTLITEGMVLEYYYAPATPGSRAAGRILAAIELDPDAREPQ